MQYALVLYGRSTKASNSIYLKPLIAHYVSA